MNIYRHTFCARCPVDGALISYSLEIRTDRQVYAEAIVAACQIDEGLHEDIADKLHRKFGGAQKIVARHGLVDIETLRP